jgi:NAD(P)-dependent dehydrogenase (short-subunit alcohol dehydrogenase family)
MEKSGLRAHTAIVTGGGGDIGGWAARELADRGHRVLVVDIDASRAQATVAAIESAGGTAGAHVADVSDEDSVRGYVASCVERFGPPDAFFNNAASEGAIADITSYPVDVFDRTVAVNLRGVFLGLRHVVAAMRAGSGRGSILNTASQAGVRGVPNLSGYVASKHGVVGLSQAVAIECAPHIRVNCLCPGPTDTRMMREIERTIRGQGGDPSGFVERIPAGRYGEPEEIGRFAAWVLADAPDYLTGAVLSVDGGMTAG